MVQVCRQRRRWVHYGETTPLSSSLCRIRLDKISSRGLTGSGGGKLRGAFLMLIDQGILKSRAARDFNM
ncbi:unnamed protein product [Camellia sinensis]